MAEGDQVTEPTTCACKSPDAHECFVMRYSRLFDEEDVDNSRGDQCNCLCHQFDLEGRNEWGVQLEEFEL